AFVVFAALMVELILLRGELTVWSARKILRFDMIYGIAAGALVAIGLMRVHFFEKGAAYYYHSATFIAKMALFIAVGLISIYPTVAYLRWRPELKLEKIPVVPPATLRKLRLAVHAELTCIVLILLMAAMMARGVGYFG